MKHILTVWFDASILMFTDFWKVDGRIEYFQATCYEYDNHAGAMDGALAFMEAGASKAEISHVK